MAQRSRPHGHDPSSIIALWRDPVRGTREIPLEAGAHGMLLTANVDLTTRRSGDGRQPVDNCLEFFDVSVSQVRAADSSSTPRPPTMLARSEPELAFEDLTVLKSWAEAIAEVLASAPAQLDQVLAEMEAGVTWREELAIEELSLPLTASVEAMRRTFPSDASANADSPLDRVLALLDGEPGAEGYESMARRVLRSALEVRRRRHLKLGLLLASDAPELAPAPA